ncbi:MAG: competence/damage-inducible protein A [Ruminococcaceae bacterium]|nr:competence/damage-inducible protein A [Oscillospiraceae bacterium]
MNAEIIAVGTELLLGQIVNTNARFLARELANLAIGVYRQTVVGDNPERLTHALQEAFSRADLVILTGGLGPTKDDLTKETVAAYFDLPLEEHAPSMRRIEDFFTRMNRPMRENNRKQALMPKGCTVLQNDHGTAPGVWMEQNGKIAVILPGPPFEMEPMYRNRVYPLLREKCPEQFYSRTLNVIGVGESELESRLMPLIEAQSDPTIAPYAKEGEVQIRITTRAASEQEAMERIDPIAEQVKEAAPGCIYGEGDITLAQAVANLLMEQNKTVATAESCTGGMIGAALTDIPGISQVYRQGYITYSNEAKESLLGVNHETLASHGAVSRETAEEMARGAQRNANADYAIAVTGIAGPDGGTPQKPVGLIYAALACPDGSVEVEEMRLVGDRDKNRRVTVKRALDLLRRALTK